MLAKNMIFLHYRSQKHCFCKHWSNCLRDIACILFHASFREFRFEFFSFCFFFFGWEMKELVNWFIGLEEEEKLWRFSIDFLCTQRLFRPLELNHFVWKLILTKMLLIYRWYTSIPTISILSTCRMIFSSLSLSL